MQAGGLQAGGSQAGGSQAGGLQAGGLHAPASLPPEREGTHRGEGDGQEGRLVLGAGDQLVDAAEQHPPRDADHEQGRDRLDGRQAQRGAELSARAA